MFINLPLNTQSNPILDILNSINNQSKFNLPKELTVGVWQVANWNPEYTFNGIPKRSYDYDEYLKESNRLQEFYEAIGKEYPGMAEYGICDNYQQILDKWPHLEIDTKKYFITLVQMNREDQPDDGGWRWHKWGEYIGIQNPQHEYLFYEEHIDTVYTYHIYTIE